MIPRNMKPDDRCLLFFIKSPQKGSVKSRLAAAIGNELTVKLYESFVSHILSTLKRGNFPFYICFHPENAHKAIKRWLGDPYQYIPQRGKDLGERMKKGFINAFEMGFKRVVLIGSDIPDLPLEFIEEAFTSLKKKDAVIGPSYDGGYYLIGFRDKTFSSQVFEGIVWGTGTVFDKTMRVFKRLRQRVHPLPYQRDIDTIEDLRNLDLGTFLRPPSNR